MPFKNSSIGIFSDFKSILPLSILLMSRISFISESRKRDEIPILEIQSATCSSFPIACAAIVLIPIIAFMGVRIS